VSAAAAAAAAACKTCKGKGAVECPGCKVYMIDCQMDEYIICCFCNTQLQIFTYIQTEMKLIHAGHRQEQEERQHFREMEVGFFFLKKKNIPSCYITLAI
jgi:hypothetical protein